MKKYRLFLASALLGAAFFGCYADNGATSGDDAGTPDTSGTSGLPCDVSTVLLNNCQMCHAATPTAGAPIPLVTRDDLMATSSVDSSQTVAERAVVRMTASSAPMPPLPMAGVAQSDIDTINNWIQAGYPAGTCATSDPGPTPFDTASTCTSGKTWNGFSGQTMAPGRTCVGCHGPGMTAGGTVYPTAHEPDDCIGAGSAAGISGVYITITDANNNKTVMGVNSSGNFYTTKSIAMPYTARVTYQGRERDMVTPQTSGDCDGCHTESGTNTGQGVNAPGRIMLP